MQSLQPARLLIGNDMKQYLQSSPRYFVNRCCDLDDHPMIQPSADIEPLEPELWFAALEQLSRRQAKAEDGSVENLLRHAFHLIQLASEALRTAVRCALDEDSFERLLDSEAFDSAAVALVGPPAGFALSCAVGNRHRVFHATVRLPGQLKPSGDARSESAARALLAAWANSLLALKQRSIEDLPPRPARHRPPVGLHPKSIEP
jgi:hypothetical protein